MGPYYYINMQLLIISHSLAVSCVCLSYNSLVCLLTEVVAVRYCYNSAIHEEFLGVSEDESLDADGRANTIIHLLQKLDVNMRSCVG